MPIKKRDLLGCLIRKFGFVRGQGTKHETVELFVKGKKVAGARLSRSHDEISDVILNPIARQIHVNLSTLRHMCDCTISAEDYVQRLEQQGRL